MLWKQLIPGCHQSRNIRLTGPARTTIARATETIGLLSKRARSPWLTLTLLAMSMAVPLGAARAQAADAQWTTPAGTVQGTRFSDLTQITAANVAQLKEEFHFTTGALSGFEGAPLVVGTTMYVVEPGVADITSEGRACSNRPRREDAVERPTRGQTADKRATAERRHPLTLVASHRGASWAIQPGPKYGSPRASVLCSL